MLFSKSVSFLNHTNDEVIVKFARGSKSRMMVVASTMMNQPEKSRLDFCRTIVHYSFVKGTAEFSVLNDILFINTNIAKITGINHIESAEEFDILYSKYIDAIAKCVMHEDSNNSVRTTKKNKKQSAPNEKKVYSKKPNALPVRKCSDDEAMKLASALVDKMLFEDTKITPVHEQKQISKKIKLHEDIEPMHGNRMSSLLKGIKVNG